MIERLFSSARALGADTGHPTVATLTPDGHTMSGTATDARPDFAPFWIERPIRVNRFSVCAVLSTLASLTAGVRRWHGASDCANAFTSFDRSECE